MWRGFRFIIASSASQIAYANEICACGCLAEPGPWLLLPEPATGIHHFAVTESGSVAQTLAWGFYLNACVRVWMFCFELISLNIPLDVFCLKRSTSKS